jgi:hypothetical protein
MTSILYISENYDKSPQVYKNFYKAVIEPALMDGHRKSVSGNDLLKNYNARWDNPSKSIVFETEQDLTYFMLRWS